MINPLKTLSIISLLSVVWACAPLPAKIEVRPFGVVDVEKERAFSEKASEIKDTSDVMVVSGQFPEGLTLMEQGTKVVVASGYEQKYQILGDVEADFFKGVSQFRSLLWTYDYKDNWRQNYCLVQAPFKLVTLGIWTLLPIAWPCVASAPSDPLDRKQALIEDLKKATKALGGNLLILSGSTDLQVTTLDRYGSNLGTKLTPQVGLRGFALRQNGVE